MRSDCSLGSDETRQTDRFICFLVTISSLSGRTCPSTECSPYQESAYRHSSFKVGRNFHVRSTTSRNRNSLLGSVVNFLSLCVIKAFLRDIHFENWNSGFLQSISWWHAGKEATKRDCGVNSTAGQANVDRNWPVMADAELIQPRDCEEYRDIWDWNTRWRTSGVLHRVTEHLAKPNHLLIAEINTLNLIRQPYQRGPVSPTSPSPRPTPHTERSIHQIRA